MVAGARRRSHPSTGEPTPRLYRRRAAFLVASALQALRDRILYPDDPLARDVLGLAAERPRRISYAIAASRRRPAHSSQQPQPNCGIQKATALPLCAATASPARSSNHLVVTERHDGAALWLLKAAGAAATKDNVWRLRSQIRRDGLVIDDRRLAVCRTIATRLIEALTPPPAARIIPFPDRVSES